MALSAHQCLEDSVGVDRWTHRFLHVNLVGRYGAFPS